MKPPRILIIAGSDSGGGAGIQADIKTVTMLGGYAMTAITAITAQNTLGVDDVHPVAIGMIEAQLRAVFVDLPPHAVKIGMVGSGQAAHFIANELAFGMSPVPIVFDPVIVATSGDPLASDGAIESFGRLMRLAAIITPNLPELAKLTGMAVETEAERIRAAGTLASAHGCHVMAKGGHAAVSRIVDLLVGPDGAVRRWEEPRIETTSTHGTGCTLASAIATGLGAGMPMVDAVERARAYVRAALVAAPGYGGGHGPLGHGLGVVPFELIHRNER